MDSNQDESYHETTEFMIQRKERDERSRIIRLGFKKSNYNKLKELVREVLGEELKHKEQFKRAESFWQELLRSYFKYINRLSTCKGKKTQSTVAALGAHHLPKKDQKIILGGENGNKTATLSRTNIKEQHSRLGTKLDRQKFLSAREKQNDKNGF